MDLSGELEAIFLPISDNFICLDPMRMKINRSGSGTLVFMLQTSFFFICFYENNILMLFCEVFSGTVHRTLLIFYAPGVELQGVPPDARLQRGRAGCSSQVGLIFTPALW